MDEVRTYKFKDECTLYFTDLIVFKEPTSNVEITKAIEYVKQNNHYTKEDIYNELYKRFKVLKIVHKQY